MYHLSLGEIKSLVEPRKWYRLAAAQGHMRAKKMLEDID